MEGFNLELPSSSDDDHTDTDAHGPIRPETVYRAQSGALKGTAIGIMRIKRDDLVQTALDVIVVSGASTVGDVLIGSIPSEPTTVSLPGFGALTLSGFAAETTDHADMAAASAMPATSNTPLSTSSTTTGTSSSSSVLTTSTSSSNAASNTSTPSSSTSSSISSSSATTTTTTTSSFFGSTTTSTSMTSTTSSLVTSPAAAPGPSAANSAVPTSSSTASPVQNSSNSSNSEGRIAGGVVGGVVGAFVLVALVFLVVRRLRQNAKGTRLDDGEDGTVSAPVSRDGPGDMAQRSTVNPFAAAVGRLRQSQQSSVYTNETGERGFQRVSGRKLTPVIHSGGDGYTEPVQSQASRPHVASNLSNDFTTGTFFRDSHGTTSSDKALEAEIPGQSFVHPETIAAHGAALQQNIATKTASSTSSMQAVPPTSNRNSRLLSTDRAAAYHRSERMFSSSPESQLYDPSDDGRTPSPDEVLVQQGPQRIPIVSRAGDNMDRSRTSQDGGRVSRFNETF